jgi:hypothetical protein
MGNTSPYQSSSLGYPRGAGIGNASSYQVSGRPFLTGNLKLDNGVEDKVVFPTVAKRVIVKNMADIDIRVHFATTASNSLVATYSYKLLATTNDQVEIEGKFTELYISNATADDGKYELFAELTGIPAENMFALTGSGISGHTGT